MGVQRKVAPKVEGEEPTLPHQETGLVLSHCQALWCMTVSVNVLTEEDKAILAPQTHLGQLMKL